MSLGKHPTVFQSEVCVIRLCIIKQIKSVKTRASLNICTYNHSPFRILDLAMSEALELYVMEWVPGRMNIEGNEKADRLANE